MYANANAVDFVVSLDLERASGTRFELPFVYITYFLSFFNSLSNGSIISAKCGINLLNQLAIPINRRDCLIFLGVGNS